MPLETGIGSRSVDEFVSVEVGRCWPSGDYVSIAIVPLSEATLASLLGARPNYGTETGLGEWVAFGGELNSVAVELIRYKHSPGPGGFELRVDSSANAGEVLGEFMRLARLQYSDLPWVAQDLVH